MTRRRGAVVVMTAAAAVVALVVVVAGRKSEDATPSADACRDPVLTTSADRTWRDGGFVVDQDMWNNQTGAQILRACSYHRWSVTATQPDTADVNTYPNVHRDFEGPRLDSFSEITSTFASRGPENGIYDFAYDIWLDGVATDGSTEIMVWTDNHGSSPHVGQQGTFTSGGARYVVYRSGRYIAFVGPQRAAGSVDLLAFFRYAVARDWLRSSSTVGQIDFGVEICSTDGQPRDFDVTDFSLTAH